MINFWKAVAKYISKNEDSPIAPHFKYKETTIIDGELVKSLWKEHCQTIYLHEALEEKSDYARLLRMENMDLKDEIACMSMDFEDSTDEPDKYLS